jgi:hypothetical protein
MAIQKEIWLQAIEDNLYKGLEAIISVSRDDSSFVNNKTIHIPSAGTAPTISSGNSTYPVAITERTDNDLSYDLTNYEIGPLRLGWADQLQLSYDKTLSIANDFLGNLSDRMAKEFMAKWYYKASGSLVATTGTSTTTNWLGGSAAGALKHLTGADVRNAAKILDRQVIPSGDRYLLLDPDMFWQLMADLDYQAARLGVFAGLPTAPGPVYGFTVIQMPYVAAVNTSDVIITPAAADGSFTYASTDRPIGLAVHKGSLSMAITSVEGFVEEKAPSYFGDVLSASIYGGASYRRYDGKGVVAIRATS